MRKIIWLMMVIVLILAGVFDIAYGQRVKVTNEMIYQKLIEVERRVVEIEKKQAVFEERFKQIDKRFEDIDKRFEDMNKRFEDIDKRFEDMNKRFEELREDMNKRFEQLYTFLWIITGIFTAIMVGAFGFAYWDRRTIIAEAKRQVYDDMEREFRPEKFRKVLSALRELAKTDKRVEEILRKEGLL
jgi:chaperonin cofactor prefoldin